MKKIFFLTVMIFSLAFSGCEKDDICDGSTVTTPRLVISFYDINDASTLKVVNNLKIIADGITEGIIYNGSDLINGNMVAIPLKPDVDLVKFKFILNFGNANPALINEDEIQFDYTRSTLFVSRACGYKTNYVLNQANPFTLTDATVPDGKWIQSISVKNRTINNENETHLEIYF